MQRASAAALLFSAVTLCGFVHIHGGEVAIDTRTRINEFLWISSDRGGTSTYKHHCALVNRLWTPTCWFCGLLRSEDTGCCVSGIFGFRRYEQHGCYDLPLRNKSNQGGLVALTRLIGFDFRTPTLTVITKSCRISNKISWWFVKERITLFSEESWLPVILEIMPSR